MALEINNMKSCAVQEIHRLENYNHDPKGAMISFCEQQLYSASGLKWQGFSTKPNQIFGAYVFNAPIYGSSPRDNTKPPQPPYGESYGDQFADFITNNKLGTVVATPVTWNRVFHPDHGNKVWVWCPDQDALKAWYAPYKAERDNAAAEARRLAAERAKAAVAAPIPPPVYNLTSSMWDTVKGIAGDECGYGCGHTFVLDEPLFGHPAHGYICDECATNLGVPPNPALR
jgi:hypothetical protein